jgi:LAGLIDADG-like domain/Intein splicing domain
MADNSEGLTLPREPIRRSVASREAAKKLILPGSFKDDVMAQQRSESRARQRLDGRTASASFDEQSARNMEGMGRRTAAAFGTDAQWAWPKLHDPFEYWRERTWWFNMEDPDEQIQKIRDWTRLMYTTHYLVPSLIDIYTRFPLLDIEFTHQDDKIADFYKELFFDGLDYEEFLFDLGREHWTVGEAFAMGSWHDGIGAWEDDEIINPNDVIVAKNRALRTYQFHIKVPDEIRKLIDTRDPAPEYAALLQLYPDVVAWARQDKEIPVSDVLMKQIKFKCVVGSTNIMTPSGPVQARDLAVGDEVIAWDEDNNKAVVSTISHQGINEPEPIYWITTQQGRKIGVNHEHPFLTNNGWVEASQLAVGDKLLVGNGYDGQRDSTIKDLDDARFFGLMAGDGSYGHKTIMFHNQDKEILDWMNTYVSQYGCKLSQAGSTNISFVISQGVQTKEPNLIKKLIQDAGIYGQTTYTKRIPSCVWESDRRAWGEFLSGYFDTDGHIDSNGMVVWTSMNRLLLEDCQIMLSFMGIESRIYDVPKYNYAPESGYGYRLIVGKKEAKNILAQYVHPLCERKTIPQENYVRNTRPSNFPWDQITGIEIGEDEETMAIGVADYHTHITAGLVTHNTNPWSEHGSPILLRAFRMLMLEESLNAAQDAIADRLYSPLILATLGLPDVDEDGPWIPDATELQQLRDDLAMAINSDFRLMTYHHGLDIKNAFGREAMPRLDQDFLRVESKVMQVFGIGAELLQGGNSNAPYASGALNRELITQMLTTYQKKIARFIQERMRPVAERQGHYEYRKVGNARIPVMETVLLVNEETGEEYVEERPKLAIPEVQFKSMNLRDETVERQFIQQLAASGFPVSLKTMAVNIPIDFKDEIEAKTEEKLQTVVAEQRFKKELFERLIALQLPIPPEYYQEFQAYMMQQENPELVAQMAPQGIADITSQPAAPNILTPGSQADADSMVGPFLLPGMIPPQRPEESDEQKKNAPKKAEPKKTDNKKKTEDKTKKKSSINGSEYEYDGGEEFVSYAAKDNGYVAEYGGRMYFGVPKEQVLRRKMTIVNGMKIVTDNQYERFNLEDFEENYRVAQAVGEDNEAASEAMQHSVADDGEVRPGNTGAGLDFQNKEGEL